MSRREIARWIVLSGVAGPSLVLASVVFPPLIVLGLASVVAGGMGLTIRYSRWVGRWSPAMWAGLNGLLFPVGAVMAFVYWGVAFDLSDRGVPVPASLDAAIATSVIVALVAFGMFLAIVGKTAWRGFQLTTGSPALS